MIEGELNADAFIQVLRVFTQNAHSGIVKADSSTVRIEACDPANVQAAYAEAPAEEFRQSDLDCDVDLKTLRQATCAVAKNSDRLTLWLEDDPDEPKACVEAERGEYYAQVGVSAKTQAAEVMRTTELPPEDFKNPVVEPHSSGSISNAVLYGDYDEVVGIKMGPLEFIEYDGIGANDRQRGLWGAYPHDYVSSLISKIPSGEDIEFGMQMHQGLLRISFDVGIWEVSVFQAPRIIGDPKEYRGRGNSEKKEATQQ